MRYVVAAIMVAALQAGLAAQERLVYETDSLYHHIIVSETESTRILRFHKGSAAEAMESDFAQSVILLEDPYALHMHYAKHVMAGAALAEKPKRALFVGLGAGTLPKFYARTFPECQVDVAELDGEVAAVARKYFFLPDLPNLHVTILDGRLFVKRTKEKYDLVMLDAYRDDMIPFHLMTKEFLEEAKGVLAENGLLISNIAIAKDTQLYPWLLRTYQSAFGTVFETEVPYSSNKVLLCKAAPKALTAEAIRAAAQALDGRLMGTADLASYTALFRDVSMRTPSTRVLTDDYAPVNLMRIRKADEKDWKY